MPYYYYDATYLLVVLGMVICLAASARVKSTMNRFHKVNTRAGITGGEAARRILNQEGLYEVQVECMSEDDGDHYDPRSNTVRLSYGTYHRATVTAVGVAAHECGHAIQHARGYAPLNFRTALVPAANIGSTVGVPIIMLGVILSWNNVLIQIGIWAFSLAVLFQLVTLPVEFNASRRAVARVEEYGLLTDEENSGCKKVLSAAAMTYVAAAASSALQLIRLVLLFGGRRKRD